MVTVPAEHETATPVGAFGAQLKVLSAGALQSLLSQALQECTHQWYECPGVPLPIPVHGLLTVLPHTSPGLIGPTPSQPVFQPFTRSSMRRAQWLTELEFQLRLTVVPVQEPERLVGTEGAPEQLGAACAGDMSYRKPVLFP